jgi:hypothetical protein
MCLLLLLLLLLPHLQTEARYRELVGMGLNVNLVLVGNKGKQYFARRPQYNIVSECHAAALAGCLGSLRCFRCCMIAAADLKSEQL